MNCNGTIVRGATAFVFLVLNLAVMAYGQDSGPIQSGIGGSGGGGGVDPFSGSFGVGLPVMHVPGPNGSGYTVMLSYQSGLPFGEASWVGYGWNLGPNAIIREKRGIPDDYADTIVYWNKGKRMYTVSATNWVGVEITSKDFPGLNDSKGIIRATPKLSSYLKYNSRMGYSIASGLDATVKGIGGIGHTTEDDESSFQAYIAPPFMMGMRHHTFSTERDRSPKNVAGFTGGAVNLSSTITISIPWFLSGIGFGVKGSVAWHQSIANTPLKAYGYMYSSQAAMQPASIMDYYSERDAPYNKKDVYLPIPVVSADNYFVGGSAFRLFQRNPGAFRPNRVESGFGIQQMGAEFHGLGRWGFGLSFGLGRYDHTTRALASIGIDSAHQYSAKGDEPYSFRFRGDLGGSVLFSDTDAVSVPGIQIVSSGAPASGGLSLFDTVSTQLGMKLPNDLFPQVNDGTRAGRSTFIGYRTNEEMLKKTSSGVFHKSYTRDTLSRGLVDREAAKLKSGIGEFAIIDGSGNRLVYGLPVYARDEKSLRLGLEGLAEKKPDAIKSGQRAYKKTVEKDAPVVIGEQMRVPYATAYLLTQITTPDYVDRTNNGPTPDDYGGYTLFHYRRAAGSKNKLDTAGNWYRWRSPYNGLSFEKGSLSDPEDDLGAVYTGEKELYYLESVETKTHVALFVTNKASIAHGDKLIRGSQQERRDGYQQMPYTSDSVEAFIAGDSTATAALLDSADLPRRNLQERLERIELYVKGQNGHADSLLQTTYLGYDYSLRRGLPNSQRHPDSTLRDGLLTLRSVWSQNLNIHNAKIHPYTFGYQYRKSADYDLLPDDLKENYSSIISYGDRYSSAAQNPRYSMFDADRWGSYRADGAERSSRLNPWVNQAPDSSFDPAAWQLKWIGMPGGGEMQVQYEQKDYSYVQDRMAMAMVSLRASIPGTTLRSYDSSADNFYYLNTADIGIDSSSYSDMSKVRGLIVKEIRDKEKKLYFRFLYALKGTNPSIDSSEYNSEYITGFATVDAVFIDTVNKGGANQWYALRVRLRGDHSYTLTTGETLNHWVPKTICWDFVRKNRRGKLDVGQGIDYRGNYPAMIFDLLGKADLTDINLWQHCRAVDYANSYIRIPVLHPKLGGGVRVKRLLNLDPGIDGHGMLYGTEYLYEVYDENRHEYISSGVAANEPSTGREENAIVDVMAGERANDFKEKFVAGKDIVKFVGPIGEALLPGASVGYSRVVARNIHTGKTNPGFAVNEFYTAKDYPFDGNYPGIGSGVDYRKGNSIDNKPPFIFPLPWIQVNMDHLFVTQGYRFVQNAMNGRAKRSSRYGGNYADPDSWALAASQEVKYFEPGEKIPVLHKLGDTVRYENMGKEMEMVSEGRAVLDNTRDVSVEGDLSISSFALFDVQPSGNAVMSINENSLRTSVVSKVIRYPAIVKGVLSYADGIYQYAENVAFNPETGSPVITRTSDGFDGLALNRSPGGHKGLYHQFGIPASHYYPAMGQKAKNERAVLANDSALLMIKYGLGPATEISFTPVDHPAQDLLCPGDLVELTYAANGLVAAIGVVTAKTPGTVTILPTLEENALSAKVNVLVLESGRTNQIGASAGSITTYGETADEVMTGRNFVPIDTTGYHNQGAIAASAQTFEKSDYAPIWKPKSAYVYRTAISSANRTLPNARVYNAGRLDTLKLFNWDDFVKNDTTRWLRTGTIRRYNSSGIPLETADALGLVSSVKLGHDSTVPLLAAANADYDEVMFTSFEEDGNDSLVAHAGTRSLRVTSSSSSLFFVKGPAGNNSFIRFWAKYSNPVLRDNPPIGLQFNLTPVSLTKQNEVAHVGEWTLYEVGTGPSSNAATIFFSMTSTGSDTVWIDDVRGQPVDAEMTCYVYDPRTFQPLAMFDADHFGAYTQYNAEGRPVRTIVETVRGLKTVQEAHINVPGVDRGAIVEQGMPMPAARPRGTRTGYRGMDATLGQAPGFTSGSADLLDFQLGPDGHKLEILGGAEPSLPDLNATPDLDLPGADLLGNVQGLKEIEMLYKREQDLLERERTELSADERRVVEQELSDLRNERQRLLKRLGISQEEMQRIHQELQQRDASSPR